jgi:hypothetical protein
LTSRDTDDRTLLGSILGQAGGVAPTRSRRRPAATPSDPSKEALHLFARALLIRAMQLRQEELEIEGRVAVMCRDVSNEGESFQCAA